MSEESNDIEIRIRYAETDRMGYLHHSRYAVLFEMGRTELLRRRGVAYRDLEDAGVFFVVTKMSVKFNVPARYDDIVVLATRVRRMTTVRIDHTYQLRRPDGVLLAEGETTLACVDRQGQVIAIPDFVRGDR